MINLLPESPGINAQAKTLNGFKINKIGDIKEGDVVTMIISVDQTTTNERRQKVGEMMKGFFES